MMTLPRYGQNIGRITSDPTPGSGEGWELIEDITVSADAQQVDITGLDGDADELYMLVCSFINPSGGDNGNFTMRFNGDAGANYNWQFGTYAGAVASAGRSTGQTSFNMRWLLTLLGTSAAPWFGLIAAASGVKRKIISQAHNANPVFLTHAFGEWENTADNITQISIISDNPDTIGAGSRIWLYRPAS